jgi:dTDP-4-amino-4,6-dideoxygalactose transaminase
MKPSIPVMRSSMPDFQEYVEEIKDIWDSRWLTNMGPKHLQLEKELIRYLNTDNITLFVNGHLALEASIKALKLTGEVITTNFTFVSTTHAIIRNGLKPVFCDINLEDYTIDTDQIEQLITEQTSAILPVHVYGNICNVYEIERIAKKYGLKVIYDAAHAFGEKLNGVGVANFGDVSMFSFHATKVFHTIEGGAVICHSSEDQKEISNQRNYGFQDEETVSSIGGNAKMNEFQAAMGLCNLRHIDGEIEKRKAAVERYRSNLDSMKGIRLLQPQPGVQSNYAYFPILIHGVGLSRDQIYQELKKDGIYTRKYFYPLTSSFQCYRDRFTTNTPVSEYVAERILTLPLFAELTSDEVDRICSKIKQLTK